MSTSRQLPAVQSTPLSDYLVRAINQWNENKSNFNGTYNYAEALQALEITRYLLTEHWMKNTDYPVPKW